MILNNVTKFPIVVIAPPRSGSSVICAQIGYELNLRHFNDITYAPDKKDIEEFLSYIQNNDRYVIKFHAFDMHRYPEWFRNKIMSGETYNVKVSRRNIYNHIASSYIAQKRNLYNYDNVNISAYNDSMVLDSIAVKQCSTRITKAIKELDELSVPFDYHVEYEKYEYNDDVCVRTPLPQNYDQIVELVKKIYDIQQN